MKLIVKEEFLGKACTLVVLQNGARLKPDSILGIPFKLDDISDHINKNWTVTFRNRRSAMCVQGSN